MEDYVYFAEAIAREAHKGQKRFGGEPYIVHPQRVAHALITREEQAAAWLHDVIEDTDITIADLADLGVPPNVLHLVFLLTRDKTWPYHFYIIGIKKSEIATRIKLADINDNMNDQPTKSMLHKYNLAKHILEDSLDYHAGCDVLKKENLRLRKFFWLNHGCPITSLYGDDGEMQCSVLDKHKPIDFKRDSVMYIINKIREGRRRKK